LDLETTFTAKAETDRLFIANVTINDERMQRLFRRFLRVAADNHGVTIGVNQKGGDFELGFEGAENYAAVVDDVEKWLVEEAMRVERRQDLDNIRGKNSAQGELSERDRAILRSYQDSGMAHHRSREQNRDRDSDLER